MIMMIYQAASILNLKSSRLSSSFLSFFFSPSRSFACSPSLLLLFFLVLFVAFLFSINWTLITLNSSPVSLCVCVCLSLSHSQLIDRLFICRSISRSRNEAFFFQIKRTLVERKFNKRKNRISLIRCWSRKEWHTSHLPFAFLLRLV